MTKTPKTHRTPKTQVAGRLIVLAVMGVLGVLGAERFIFSADGVTAGSSPRELPSQGFDRSTGRVVVGLHMRTDEECAACGWWRIVQTPKPEAQSNEVWRVTAYDFGGGCATQRWTCSWRKVEPRTWTPLAIKRACGARWPTVKAALQQADIYEDFVMAQEIREDDDAFQRGYAWAVGQYGKEAVDRVLEEAR